MQFDLFAEMESDTPVIEASSPMAIDGRWRSPDSVALDKALDAGRLDNAVNILGRLKDGDLREVLVSSGFSIVFAKTREDILRGVQSDLVEAARRRMNGFGLRESRLARISENAVDVVEDVVLPVTGAGMVEDVSVEVGVGAGVASSDSGARAVDDEKPVSAEKVGRANTEDSGKELVFNKRNRLSRGLRWEDVADESATFKSAEVTKDKVYPRPDYQALVDVGIHPVAVHIVKQTYDAIAVKPVARGVVSDEGLRRYIDAVNRCMNGVMEWVNDDVSVKGFFSKIGQRASALLGAMKGQVTPLSALGGGVERSLLEAVYPEGWKNFRDEVLLIGGNKVLSVLQPGTDEVMKGMKDIDKGWPGKSEAWQKQGFQIVQASDLSVEYYADKRGVAGAGEPYVAVWIGLEGNRRFKNVVETVVDGAESQDDPRVQAYVKEKMGELQDKYLLLDKRSRLVGAFESVEVAQQSARAMTQRKKGVVQVKEEGVLVSQAERVGREWRMEEENISSDRLKDAFGFSGVNFGNWMKGGSPALLAERQLHLNHLFDSFMDLSEILGVPPKALSLNGTLGIAVGAQGSGGFAAAHFVPKHNEINITRTKGAGSIAHEWAHALDHYFAVQAGLDRNKDPYLSEHVSMRVGGGIRPEIVGGFREIVNAMNKRPMTEDEIEAQQKMAIVKTEKNLNAWLALIRRDFEQSAGVRSGAFVRVGDVDVPLIQRFDDLAQKVRDLDVGDGKLAISGQTHISPVVGEMRELFKKSSGRVYSIANLKGLQSNIDHLVYMQGAEYERQAFVVPMKTTDYSMNAAKLDKEKGGSRYWNTDMEKFARAFDAFVSDELEAKVQKNSYLSHTGREDETVPMGEERQVINRAFKGLVNTIESRETEMGQVAFFSREEDEGEEPEVFYSQLRRALEDAPDKASGKIDPIALAEQAVLAQVLTAEKTGDETLLYGPRTVGGMIITDEDGFDLHIEYIARSPDNHKETGFSWHKGGVTSAEWTLDNKWYTPEEIREWARETADEEGVPKDMSPYSWMMASARIPVGEDRQVINRAFKGLVNTIESRETEMGQVAFFSREEDEGEEPEVFYSQLRRALEDAPDKVFGSGKQTKMWLLANAARLGVKKEEIQWTGITDWLDLQQGKVIKDDVLAYLDANGVQVEEVMLSNDTPVEWSAKKTRDGGYEIYANNQSVDTVYGHDNEDSAISEVKNSPNLDDLIADYGMNTGNTKYADYVVPGGTNYRELLLTLPIKTPEFELRSIAQMRVFLAQNHAVNASLKGMSDVEKLKALNKKRAKEGAPTMFRSSHFDQLNILAHVRFDERTDDDGNKVLFVQELQSDWGQKFKKQENIPAAPFVTDTKAWVALAIKRIISHAVNNGFDKVAFASGEQNAEHYDLSKQVVRIEVSLREEGSRYVKLVKPQDDGLSFLANSDGVVVKGYGWEGKKVGEVVGKDIAEKIMSATSGTVIEGDGLRVGGEGMRAFYDKIVPQVANDVLKKIGGGTINETFIPNGVLKKTTIARSFTARSITITPELRAKVRSGGMPLFSREDEAGGSEQLDKNHAGAKILGLVGVKVGRAMFDSGLIRFVDAQRELGLGKGHLSGVWEDSARLSKKGAVKGVTFTDSRMALVLENLTEKNFEGVACHEFFHSAARGWLGESAYEMLMDKLEGLHNQAKWGGGVDEDGVKKWFVKASEAIPKSTPAAHVMEEMAGYAIEQYVNGEKQPGKIREWVGEALSVLKLAMVKVLPAGPAKKWAVENLEPRDLAKLAVVAMKGKAREVEVAREMAEKSGRMRFSVGEGDDGERRVAEVFDWSKRTPEPVLTLPFEEGVPNAEKAAAITSWVKKNADIYANKLVKLYHATDPNLPIEQEGLKPTSTARRRSFQSESGYVYLAATPDRAKNFGDLGNQGRSVVYEVLVRVRQLLPDKDQLNNQRSVGKTVGNSVGESVVYGGGVRVKGRIEPWAVRKMSEQEIAVMRERPVAAKTLVEGVVTSGEHYGPIKEVIGNKVVQGGGPKGDIVHDLRNFKDGVVPKFGDRAKVKYGKDGLASVVCERGVVQER